MDKFGYAEAISRHSPANSGVMASKPLIQRAAGVGLLATKISGGATRIDTLFQEGAAKLRFPASGGRDLEAVMINTAGGLTGGDQMTWDFIVEKKGSLTVTTQACEKIYKATKDCMATVSARAYVKAGARLAWLPQETILFERSALQRRIDIELAKDARLLLAEAVIFGRMAMGEEITTAHFTDRWRIRCCGKLVHAEDFALGSNAKAALSSPALLGGYRAMANIVLIDDVANVPLEAVRSIIGKLGGASCFAGKLVARLIDHDAYSLRLRLVPLLRLLGGPDVIPRIWST